MNSNKSNSRGVIRESAEFLSTIIKSVLIALFMVMFIMQSSDVEGSSMEPSLYTGERLMIDKISYEFVEPKRGDIVVIELADSEVPLIKRVIAVAGETVEIRSGVVFVNGVQVVEPYVTNMTQQNYGPVTVSAEHIFVLGDNRAVSRDSRSFGTVDVYRVIGKARFRVWPPEVAGVLN